MESFVFPTASNGTTDHQTWWPPALPAMSKHPLFVNFALTALRDVVQDKLDLLQKVSLHTRTHQHAYGHIFTQTHTHTQVSVEGGNKAAAKLQVEIAQEALHARYPRERSLRECV